MTPYRSLLLFSLMIVMSCAPSTQPAETSRSDGRIDCESLKVNPDAGTLYERVICVRAESLRQGEGR